MKPNFANGTQFRLIGIGGHATAHETGSIAECRAYHALRRRSISVALNIGSSICGGESSNHASGSKCKPLFFGCSRSENSLLSVVIN